MLLQLSEGARQILLRKVWKERAANLLGIYYQVVHQHHDSQWSYICDCWYQYRHQESLSGTHLLSRL